MFVDINLQFFEIEDVQEAHLYMHKFVDNFVSTM